VNHSIKKGPKENVSLKSGDPAAEQHFVTRKIRLPVETGFDLQERDENERRDEEEGETAPASETDDASSGAGEASG